MKKLSILILFLALIQVGFGKNVASLPDVMNAEYFVVDGDKFFISEGVHIYIYNLSDYKLLRKIGKEGEGPQEFKVNAQAGGLVMAIQPDYIYVSSMDKISYFTRNGDFIKEMRKKTSFTTYFYPIGSQHVGITFAEEDKKIFQTVVLYDSGLKRVKEIFRQDHFFQHGRFNPVGQLPVVETYKDKIVVGGTRGIFVFNAKGEKEATIIKPFEEVAVEDSHKKEVIHFYKTDIRLKHLYQSIKQNFQFPPYFCNIKTFKLWDDKIYVQTYKRKGDQSEIVILDLKGKLIKKTFLPVAEKNLFEPYPYSVYNGKFYQLVENIDEEEWELHVFPIE